MPFSNEELQTRLDQLDALMYRVQEEHGTRDMQACLVLAKQVLSNMETFSNFVDAKTWPMFQEMAASFDRLYTALKETASRDSFVSVTFATEAEALRLDC